MKLRVIIISILFQVAISFSSYSQGVLQVKISESGSNKPIELVNVQIEGTTIGSVTDEKGEIEVKDWENMDYDLSLLTSAFIVP